MLAGGVCELLSHVPGIKSKTEIEFRRLVTASKKM